MQIIALKDSHVLEARVSSKREAVSAEHLGEM